MWQSKIYSYKPDGMSNWQFDPYYLLAEDEMVLEQNSRKQFLFDEAVDNSSTAVFIDTNSIEQSPVIAEMVGSLFLT